MARSKTQMVKRRVLPIDMGPQFGRTYLVSLADLLASDIDLHAWCALPEWSARLASSGVEVIRLPVFCGRFKPLRFLASLTVARFEVCMPL